MAVDLLNKLPKKFFWQMLLQGVKLEMIKMQTRKNCDYSKVNKHKMTRNKQSQFLIS